MQTRISRTMKMVLTVACAAALAVVCATVAGCGIGAPNVKHKELTSYCYYTGGDMRGSSYSEYVDKFDETHALISISQQDWYAQDPQVTEYLVDIQVLQEIRDNFDRWHMERWHNKTFSHLFIADGASHGYTFTFGAGANKEWVSFSSQSYPLAVSEKLAALHGAVSAFTAIAEPLPGLVLEPVEDEVAANRYHPEDGEIRLEVFEYSRGDVHYRLSNGTDDMLSWTNGYTVTDAAGTVIASGDGCGFELDLYPHSLQENETIQVGACLPAGVYTLQVGKYTCIFELR